MLAGIIVGVLAIGLVVFTIVHNIRQRKNGKSSCGCDCSKCSGCALKKHDNN